MRAFILRNFLRCFLVALSVSATHSVLAQRKVEGDKKLPEKAVADQNPATPSDETLKDEEKEDPLFKGMKYRIVGPFRGGRSLTAAGVAGDPNTYYFGATGGGVWKSTAAR